MRSLVATLVFFTLSVAALYSAAARTVTLHMPHALRAGETAWLEVKLGVIARGDEITIATPGGRLLGTLSPFGIRAGEEAGAYTVPLPADVISDDQVELRVSVVHAGREQREPTTEEVKSISVKVATSER